MRDEVRGDESRSRRERCSVWLNRFFFRGLGAVARTVPSPVVPLLHAVVETYQIYTASNCLRLPVRVAASSCHYKKPELYIFISQVRRAAQVISALPASAHHIALPRFCFVR